MKKDSEASVEMGLRNKLHSETAQIAWRELQRFFAQGRVLQLDSALDLVETAASMAEDNAGVLKSLIEQHQLVAPDDEQARRWFESDAVLWSVVVAPYVLVQEQA